MQTVNFNCPQCGNLMAVTSNLLGRNVRCPHCKHVVRAPAAAGEAPPPTPTAPLPTFNVPQQTEHHESIFGERHDEDVFGSEPPKPLLPPKPDAPLPPTMPMQAVEPMTFDPPPPPAYTPPAPLDERPPPSSREERAVSYRPRPQREVAASTPAFVWMLFAYAAVVTAAAGFFGFQYFTAKPSGDHPFKAIPDYYGQYEKANRRSLSFNGLPDPKGPVPDGQRVALGGELVVGDLQVRPVSVTKQVIEGATRYVDREDQTYKMSEGLVLTLRVKNLSTDTTFHPNDPAFTRAADPKQPAPYTALEIHGKFFPGTFPWPPEEGVTGRHVVGHEADFEPLAPGAERDTWVVARPKGAKETSGDALRALDAAKGDDWLTWRVQLRRGIVTVTEGGQSIPLSATTVIGVDFRKDQVGAK